MKLFCALHEAYFIFFTKRFIIWSMAIEIPWQIDSMGNISGSRKISSTLPEKIYWPCVVWKYIVFWYFYIKIIISANSSYWFFWSILLMQKNSMCYILWKMRTQTISRRLNVISNKSKNIFLINFNKQETFIHKYIWLLSLHLTSNSTYDLNLFCCTITILFFTRNFTYWSGLNHCCNILPAQPTSVSGCKEVIRLIKSRPYRRSNARPAWTGSIELTYIAFFKT